MTIISSIRHWIYPLEGMIGYDRYQLQLVYVWIYSVNESIPFWSIERQEEKIDIIELTSETPITHFVRIFSSTLTKWASISYPDVEIEWSLEKDKSLIPITLFFNANLYQWKKEKDMERFSLRWLSVDQQHKHIILSRFVLFRCSLHPSAIYTHASKRYSHVTMSKYVYLRLVYILCCSFHLHRMDVRKWRISSSFCTIINSKSPMTVRCLYVLWECQNAFIQTCLRSIRMCIQEQKKNRDGTIGREKYENIAY